MSVTAGHGWELIASEPEAWCWSAGAVRRDEARQLLAHLRRGFPVAVDVPVRPWAMVVREPDGSVLATCAPTLVAGLFHTHAAAGNDECLLVGLDPRSVFEAAGVPSGLNPAFVLGFLTGGLPSEMTPLTQVHRLLPGDLLRWRPARRLRVERWWRETPTAVNPRRGREVVESYLQTIDQVLDEMAQGAGALSAEMSAGLDSTFVVAGLAQSSATSGRRIRAYTHAPVLEAEGNPNGTTVHDEYHTAQLMERAYPEVLEVVDVRNDAGESALDAARAFGRASWWPALNPTNTVWMEQIKDRARARGSRYLFSGSRGNLAFSHPHSYAVRAAGLHGDLAAAARGVRYLRSGGARWAGIAGMVAPRRRTVMGSGGVGSFLLPSGREAMAGANVRSDPRQTLLDGLFGRNRPYSAALNPRATGGLIVVDPFTAPSVVREAISIDPVEWLRGPAPRGLARVMMAGRVPDDIRLRRTRGAQASDTWWHMRNSRDRYRDEAALLAHTPILSELVDGDAVARTIEGWPWGSKVPGPHAGVAKQVTRILALAEFVRYLTRAVSTGSAAPRPGLLARCS